MLFGSIFCHLIKNLYFIILLSKYNKISQIEILFITCFIFQWNDVWSLVINREFDTWITTLKWNLPEKTEGKTSMFTWLHVYISDPKELQRFAHFSSLALNMNIVEHSTTGIKLVSYSFLNYAAMYILERINLTNY